VLAKRSASSTQARSQLGWINVESKPGQCESPSYLPSGKVSSPRLGHAMSETLQSILVLLRPALVNAHNECCDLQTKSLRSPSNTTRTEPYRTVALSRLQAMHQASLESARETATILQWLEMHGALCVSSCLCVHRVKANSY
jgi:hypothetical protein